uniref:3-oxoacyl-[acyl-carrier-protein] reductase n=1 Tax=Picea sitchensis TaxID=3332 RepID=D5ACM9_PICSI|nr:unknown [Picea sitchensis]
MGRKGVDSLEKGLEGKVVLVTGASSGLGREFALSFARRGCNIVATARRTQLLISLCQDIDKLNNSAPASLQGCSNSRLLVKALAVKLDVSQSDAVVDAAVGIAWQCFGRIDVLINNAGFRGNVNSSLDLKEDEWNKVITTNLRGTWLVSKAVGKRMREAKRGGSIINISSIGGLPRGELPGGIAYSASKAGINAMTKIMALELGMYNIRVNAVAPGLFRSEITAGLMEKDWLNTVARKIVPLQTWGEIEPTLTSTLHLLASDTSAYTTGNIVIIDGGQSLPGVPLYSSL